MYHFGPLTWQTGPGGPVVDLAGGGGCGGGVSRNHGSIYIIYPPLHFKGSIFHFHDCQSSYCLLFLLEKYPAILLLNNSYTPIPTRILGPSRSSLAAKYPTAATKSTSSSDTLLGQTRNAPSFNWTPHSHLAYRSSQGFHWPLFAEHPIPP